MFHGEILHFSHGIFTTPTAPHPEVAILGNCKRFDIYVALAQPVEATEVGRHVAEAICQQMAWHHEMAGLVGLVGRC